jgi:DNA polymerase gamma 1
LTGAGAKHAIQLLLKDNPGISRKEAEAKVTQLYQKTKGRRFGYGYKNKASLPLLWYGGSESFMFNSMENIARSEDPRTPVLSCGIPDSLLPKYVDNNVRLNLDSCLRLELNECTIVHDKPC